MVQSPIFFSPETLIACPWRRINNIKHNFLKKYSTVIIKLKVEEKIMSLADSMSHFFDPRKKVDTNALIVDCTGVRKGKSKVESNWNQI